VTVIAVLVSAFGVASFAAAADDTVTDVATSLVDIVPLIKRFQPTLSWSQSTNGSAVAEVTRSAQQEAIVFLSANGVHAWESYPAFIMANTTATQRVWLESQGLAVASLENRTVVSRGTYRWDTRLGEPVIPDDLRAVSDADFAYSLGIVQLIGPIKQEWLAALRAVGVIPISYLPNFAFLARVPDTSVSKVALLPFVQWFGKDHPAYRVSSDLTAVNSSAPGRVMITATNVSGDVGLLNLKLRSTGLEVLEEYEYLSTVYIVARGDYTSIMPASRLVPVTWIEPLHEGGLKNDFARWVIQSGVWGSTPVHDHGLDGAGQIITMMDSGLTYNHEMFSDPEGDPIGPSHRKVLAYYVPGGGATGDGVDCRGHGTHVAGSAIGDAPYYQGSNPIYGTYNLYDGMAFRSRIIVQDIGYVFLSLCANGFPSVATNAYTAARDAGSYVHTNSWGRSPVLNPAKYTSYDNTLDDFVWNNPSFLVLHGAGNEGDRNGGLQNLLEEASAKNVVTVGGTLAGEMSTSMWGLSSRGSTKDGRLKPTVVAPAPITSASDPAMSECTPVAGHPNYQGCTGTSYSTPIVAGAAAQIRQYFVDGWYPMGVAVVANGFVPSGALLRAMLINGAVEISGDGAYRSGQSYPNNDQGWGRVNLDNALYFQGDQRGLLVVDERMGLQTGQWVEYPVQVSSGQPLEATLVWSDPAGAADCNPCLVNNLDLQITDPLGNQYKGNVFAGANPGQSTTGGLHDALNVEEGVLRLQPMDGTWRVRVTAANVPTGPQPFAVVVTGALSNAPELQVSTWIDHSIAPATVIDAEGRTHMVWQDKNDGGYEVYYARLSSSGSLEIRRQLTSSTYPSANPSIALNPADLNEVWVAFQQGDSYGTNDLRYTKSQDAGVTWNVAREITDPVSLFDFQQPSIVIDSHGRKHVVARLWSGGANEQEWVDYFRTDMADPGYGDWTEFVISSTYSHPYTSCTENPMVFDPNIARGPDARKSMDYLQVAYSADPSPECGTGWGATYVKHLRSTDRGATWSAETTLGTTIDYARPNAIVTANSGIHHVYVAWQDWSINFEISFVKSTNDGSSWGTPTIFSLSGYQIHPTLAYMNGVLAIAWGDDSYGNYEIAVKKSTDYGSTWTSPARVTNDAAVSLYPALKMDSTSANYLLAWADTRNNGNSWYDVYFRRLAV